MSGGVLQLGPAVEAVVPEREDPREPLGALPLGADPRGFPATPPPFGAKVLRLFDLERLLARMSFDMLANVRSNAGSLVVEDHG